MALLFKNAMKMKDLDISPDINGDEWNPNIITKKRTKDNFLNWQRDKITMAVRIKIRHKGDLGGKGFFSKTASERRTIERRLARKKGEKKVVGKLRAIQVFNENRNPEVSEKARKDARYISGEFRGKKNVGYPKGFSRRKLRDVA